MAAGVACVFPTFPMRTADFTRDRLPGFATTLDGLVARASRVVPIAPHTFDPPGSRPFDASLEQTLHAHYACFLESLAMADWMAPRTPPCDYVAGYSMGLFAALVHSGAMAFEDVLGLMRDICVEAHQVTPPGAYAVGAIVGLSLDTVRELVAGSSLEVTDVYASTTALVTGGRDAVIAALDAGIARGAVVTRLIPLTAPFHTATLADVAVFTARALDTLHVAAPKRPIVSAITQQVLSTADDVRADVPRNVSHAMDWYSTMHALAALGITHVIECGASTSLTALARQDFAGSCVSQDFHDFESDAG